MDFTPSARQEHVEPIEFSIMGEPYLFHPPQNSALAVGIVKARDGVASLRAMYVWLGQGLSPEHEPYGGYKGHTSYVEDCQACRLEARISNPDPQQQVPIELVTEVVNWLLSQTASRPPTSPGASSGMPSGAGPSSMAGAPGGTSLR